MTDIQELKNKIREIEQSTEVDCSNHSSALSRIIRLCSYRERSSYDMRMRLRDEEYDEVEIDEAIEDALRMHIIDDVRFAESLIRSRLNASKGLSGCAVELRKHGIDPESVDYYQELLCSYQREDELQRALSVLRHSPIHAKNVRDAAYRKLVSRGFSSDIAVSAARIYSENAI